MDGWMHGWTDGWMGRGNLSPLGNLNWGEPKLGEPKPREQPKPGGHISFLLGTSSSFPIFSEQRAYDGANGVVLLELTKELSKDLPKRR